MLDVKLLFGLTVSSYVLTFSEYCSLKFGLRFCYGCWLKLNLCSAQQALVALLLSSSECPELTADTNIKSITEWKPRVLRCQVHLWTPLCLNVMLNMDKLALAQKSDN